MRLEFNMLPSFNEYMGAGYYVHYDNKYNAIIRKTNKKHRRWYGGACLHEEKSVPLFGPYYFKRTAKKVALLHLNALKECDISMH